MADDQATQADKAQAPATFSSFINKSGSGNKFAPKAARRRPGPAPAAAQKPAAPGPAPAPAPGQAPAPAPSTAEPQTDPHPEPRTDPHTDPPTSQAPPQPSTTAHATAPAPPPLPTPAPTQAPATQHAPPPTAPAPAAPPSAIAATEPAALATAPTPTVHESPSAQPTQNAPPPPTPQAEHHVQPGTRSRQGTPMMPVAVMLPSHDAQPLDTISHGSTPHSQDPVASTAPSAEGEAPAQQKRKRRSLPWTAVNHPQEEGGEATDLVEPPAKKKRAPPKPRAKKTTAAADTEEQHEDGAETAPPTQTRATARARGKRQAVAPELGQDGQPVEPPPNKSRRSAKDSPEGDTDDADTTATPKPKPKPKPRAPRRNKATPAPGEDGSVEPKRRGRPPREATPEDAEDHVIDPDAICMDDLASRNIRVGKLSRREREMRKIDWDAVKQRRREEDARHISTKESQAAVDKLLEMGQVEQPPTGPRYHVVDGRIELIQDSGTIDRERDADREIELMTITEEDDLTTRITARSFMKNNKRFPNEFVLPGQGRRWNAHSTDMFYQGLRSFGTDFQMIAHMFPGMTRRSIKTKFTREERENPDIVRECLRGKSELASHWTHFLAASQLEEESFADADKIKHELEEEEARMRTQINEALREKEERDKQRKLAGVVTDDGPDGDKDAKGRKKRRLKDKNVTFQEDGVEVLGDVDDDPNWGC